MKDLNLTLPYYTPVWGSKRPIYRISSQGGTSANRLIGPTLARQIKNTPLASFVPEFNAWGFNCVFILCSKEYQYSTLELL